jgi:hypothetical protein
VSRNILGQYITSLLGHDESNADCEQCCIGFSFFIYYHHPSKGRNVSTSIIFMVTAVGKKEKHDRKEIVGAASAP